MSFDFFEGWRTRAVQRSVRALGWGNRTTPHRPNRRVLLNDRFWPLGADCSASSDDRVEPSTCHSNSGRGLSRGNQSGRSDFSTAVAQR